uniref:Uncharacterized protein n=1 Tax=Daucus carota subsp. sativus TaxID=79200 RepID=A0A175YH65_DAUCS
MKLSELPKAEGVIKFCEVDVECDYFDPYCKAIGKYPECHKFLHICTCKFLDFKGQLSADKNTVDSKHITKNDHP